MVVAMNETWVCEWHKRFRDRRASAKSKGYVMLRIMIEIFFDALGLAIYEVTAEGRTVERNEHQNTTSPQGYSEKETSENGVLRHFVSTAYRSLVVKTYLAKHNKGALEHPPHSLDLLSPDCFLFPRLQWFSERLTIHEGRGNQFKREDH
jgi:hypothetical protein